MSGERWSQMGIHRGRAADFRIGWWPSVPAGARRDGGGANMPTRPGRPAFSIPLARHIGRHRAEAKPRYSFWEKPHRCDSTGKAAE